MVKDKKLLFLRIYKILLSVSIVIAGVCLIAGCLNIYYSGNGYSREIVVSTFAKICVPVFVCIAFIVGSFFVTDKTKSKFYRPKNFKQDTPPKLNNKTLLIIKSVVIAIGIVAIIFGAIKGGFADVLTKAVNICTECIGLG